MRYYIDIKNMRNINKLLPYNSYKKNEKQILTKDGMFKYVNEELYKFKLNIYKHQLQETNIAKSFITPSHFQWKKYDNAYNLPTIHCIINVNIAEYKLNNKSRTKFIVETVDDVLNDYYFESGETIDNHSLLEDINTFLSMLK